MAPVHEVGVVELLCRTHLGHLLSAGDLVWGFHLGTANCNDTNLDLMKQGQKPTVVSFIEFCSFDWLKSTKPKAIAGLVFSSIGCLKVYTYQILNYNGYIGFLGVNNLSLE